MEVDFRGRSRDDLARAVRRERIGTEITYWIVFLVVAGGIITGLVRACSRDTPSASSSASALVAQSPPTAPPPSPASVGDGARGGSKAAAEPSGASGRRGRAPSSRAYRLWVELVEADRLDRGADVQRRCEAHQRRVLRAHGLRDDQLVEIHATRTLAETGTSFSPRRGWTVPTALRKRLAKTIEPDRICRPHTISVRKNRGLSVAAARRLMSWAERESWPFPEDR